MASDPQDESIDRGGIGMLYAGSAGMAVGTSVAYGADPIFGWIGGAAVMAFGLGYEFPQRITYD